MSPDDLVLEDGIKDIGNKLASPPSDLQQLLLLLDKAENLLSRVEQSPPTSMLTAVQPAMKALIAKDLLGHSDMDVKVAVASCISEITRITAPEAPYDDDIMKEIFGLIVCAFKNLDEMSSRSFLKRVSILETVAKVRSCVLMLDLDCDDLILEMFQHFLKTIRSKHSDTVFSSMETVMTLVLEETESISAQILSCLLDCVKVVEKNILPTAKKLAEKVLVNCSLKLKPYLAELFNSNGALLSDYSKIVAAVSQGKLDTSIQNEMNASGENREADHKLSERFLSDNSPQGSAQQEGEIFHPEISVAAADGSCKPVTSNGSFLNGNGTVKPDRRSDLSSRKGGRNALLQLSIRNDHYGVGNKKKSQGNSGRRKGNNKEAEISQADGPSKDTGSAVCSKIENKNELELASDSPDLAAASVSFHRPNDHDGNRSRRYRLSQSSDKRNAVFSKQAISLELPIRDLISSKSEALGNLERKQLTGSTKKPRSSSAKNDKRNAKDSKSTPTATSDSDKKLPSNGGRNGSQRKVRVNFSENKQTAGTKKQKGVKHAEAEDEDLKLKELLSSQKSTVKDLVKDHKHVKDTGKTKSRLKRAQGVQEAFGPRKRRKGLDDTIVGSKIKIWWPDDQRTVFLVLLLKKEQWEFIEGEAKMHGEKDETDAAETSEKAKGGTGSAIDKTDFPLKSPDSGVSGHLPKHRARRVKIRSDEVKSSSISGRKSRNGYSEESHKDSNRKDGSSNKLEVDSPKISWRIQHGQSKIRGEVVKDTPKKRHGKSYRDSSRSGRNSKNNIHISIKKSGVSNDYVSRSMEGSPKPESSEGRRKPKPKSAEGRHKSMENSPKPKSAEGHRKPSSMQGKGLIQKAKGGMKHRIISKLNAKGTSGNSHSELGKTDGITSGKKRKRARVGK